MHVYHVASSTVNPLVFGDLSRFLFQHFTRSPYSDAAGQPIAVPPMRLFDTMEQFASYVETDALLRSARAGVPAGERLSQRLQELCAKSVEQTIHLGSIYQPYTFYTGRSSLSLSPTRPNYGLCPFHAASANPTHLCHADVLMLRSMYASSTPGAGPCG